MKYIKKILGNGMHIIMVPIKYTKIISMGFFIKAGSRNETDENSGIAHFLEHMMFKGTKNRNAKKLFSELDTMGSLYNAATTTQHTYYYIYGNSDNTKHLLDIILDIYINTVFVTKEINNEKKVIIEEMRMRSDAPLMKLYSKMHQTIFKDTSLARDVIGNIDTVTNFQKKDLIDFRLSLYKPENTIFVMAGNFNPLPIYQILEKILSPLSNSRISTVTYFNEKPIIMKNIKKQSEPYIYVEKNINYQQVYMLLAFPIYDLYSHKKYEIDLLHHLLSSGFSSRLNKALREKNGITYVSAAYPVIYSDSGLFLIQMVVNPLEFMNGLKIILTELKKIKTELISKDEMIKIINVTKNETIYSLSRPIDVLIHFGINFLLDRNFNPDTDKEFNKLKNITRVQIQKVAKEIFIRDKINLFIYGNITETNFDFMDL